MTHSKLEAWLLSVLRNGTWFWNPARSDALVDIQGRVSEVAIGECDKPMWVISKKKKYTGSETWEEIRMKKQVVDWWQIRWFPLNIHKQAFVM